MRTPILLAALGLAASLLAVPAAATADDFNTRDDYPVFHVDSFPSHGVTLRQHDCDGNPVTDRPKPYSLGWDPQFGIDDLTFRAIDGTTSIGVDVADSSLFQFWDFDQPVVSGTAEVSVDLANGAALRASAPLATSQHAEGLTEAVISKDQPFVWTQYDAAHPSGLVKGTASIAGLPDGFTGPMHVALTLSDCDGKSANSAVQLSGWWLDAGSGEQWQADLGRPHQLALRSSVSKTQALYGHKVVLTAQPLNLLPGDHGTLYLSRHSQYNEDGAYYQVAGSTIPWTTVRTISISSSTGAVHVALPARFKATYQWLLSDDRALIDSVSSPRIRITATPRMTLHIDRTNVEQGTPVTVSGTVDGRAPGRVTLYRVRGDRLVKIKTAPGRRTYNAFRFSFTPHAAGTWTLVAKKTATPELDAGTSDEVAIRVR